MFDFVVIGDIMIDRILNVTNPEIVRTIDTVKHTVTFPYPNKINLLKAPETQPGGNAYNAAHCLKQLGLNTALYTIVGTDHDGQKMIEDIKAKGVDCSLVQTDNEQETNSAIILNINSDRTLFSYHFPRKYVLPTLPETKYVYLTSIGEDDLVLFKSVVEQKAKLNFKLIFAPGTLQVTEELGDVRDILQATDLLILNKSEAVKLSRLNTESNDSLLHGLQRLGPKSVIITRSERGSVALEDGNEVLKVGSLEVQVVESTGAGDTYAATVGGALALGKSLKEAMELGALNSANAIQSVGGTTGQMAKEDLEKMYQEKVSQLKYVEATSSEIGIPKPSEHFGNDSV